MNPKVRQTLLGILTSNFFALIIIGLTRYLTTRNSSAETVFVFSEFFILPMLMGIICAWFWKGLNYRRWRLALYTLCDIMLAIALSYIFMGEGVICLVIVSPLILTFVYIGVVIGRAMFRKNNRTLNVSILALLMLLFITDALFVHTYQNEVSDTMVINAPVASVWKNVVAFKRIDQKSVFWLFDIGLPRPMETTVSGYYKGAGRKCIFSNGYVFDEKISAYEENDNLTFDITAQPRDPEIMNHIDITRGQFLLKDNGNGTTTLTGNSWYKLYVFPSWYYDIWASAIVRNVHIRVMKHIREISEEEKQGGYSK